jgi:ABC-type branched-subunit amino acid transport system substrate-binding protein
MLPWAYVAAAVMVSAQTAAPTELLPENGQGGPGDTLHLLLAVPLTGPRQVLGKAALRGAQMAIGDANASRKHPHIQIVIRDTASDREANGVADLAGKDTVLGIVGVGDAEVSHATRGGVPFVALKAAQAVPAAGVFPIVHTVDARVRELARRALAAGALRFAVLAPDGEAAARIREVFSRAVQEGGGRVAGHATYPAGATSFTAAAAEIKRVQFEALFIPETARRLELVAPALAVVDLWARPRGPHAPRAEAGNPRREFLLLSTATGLGQRLTRNAQRYVQGALLAPGFFAFVDESATESTARFIARFRELHRQDPSAADAYSYDAVSLLCAQVEAGARTRADVLARLAGVPFAGVTGVIRFSEDKGRIDPPRVYVVEGAGIRLVP